MLATTIPRPASNTNHTMSPNVACRKGTVQRFATMLKFFAASRKSVGKALCGDTEE